MALPRLFAIWFQLNSLSSIRGIKLVSLHPSKLDCGRENLSGPAVHWLALLNLNPVVSGYGECATVQGHLESSRRRSYFSTENIKNGIS